MNSFLELSFKRNWRILSYFFLAKENIRQIKTMQLKKDFLECPTKKLKSCRNAQMNI